MHSFSEIIELKKNKKKLSKSQLQYLIDNFVSGEIKDYQMSAMSMAILLNGMTDEEISDLTEIMMNSGDIVSLKEIKGIKVDKHSTGGVGDKTSIALAPIVAACGAPVAKMSGRGLGITGGTLDKLESIPGFKVEIKIKDFIKQVQEIGLAIIGQTENLVPADKKLYALRDVSGTVNSHALIVSSIMSKKLATGADAISLDVKAGDGAFAADEKEATELAKLLVRVGKKMNRDVVAHITNMNEPLGRAIGNAIEVIEAVETIKGKGPEDFTEIVIESAVGMLIQAKVCTSTEEAKKKIDEVIKNGKALEKLKQMIEYQHGNASFLDDYKKLFNPKNKLEVKASESGYVKWTTAKEIGLVGIELGAGRKVKEDKLDYQAGIYLNKQTGEKVAKGEVVATLYCSKEIPSKLAKDIENSFKISGQQHHKENILGEIK